METARERDWMTREEAEAFIGDNSDFYMGKWKSHSSTALKGWNWAAAIFGIEWMAYRKMYWETALFFAISAVLTFVLVLIGLDGDLWGDTFRILIGVFGNALYRKKALRTLRKADTEEDSERLKTLARKGGASPASVAVMLVLEVLYLFVVFVLLP